jgi:hypothetical protein
MESRVIRHFFGLDLAQLKDYSALAGIEQEIVEERIPGVGRPGYSAYYTIVYLKRWELGTPYPQIVADVAERVKRPPLDNPTLVVDGTGVGTAIVDLLRDYRVLRAILRPVLITAGHEIVLAPNGYWHVPKKELVGVINALGQPGRLKTVCMAEREMLERELLAFRTKITVAGNETFEAWRERDHDDLVLAVAIACWLAEHTASAATIAAKPTWVSPEPREREPRDRSIFDEHDDSSAARRRGLFVAGHGHYSGGEPLPPGFEMY